MVAGLLWSSSSYLDAYHNIIKELLSTSNQQIFYYKSTLWQYLTDNHGLTCPESSFRRYISKYPEFQVYFNQRKKHPISNKTIFVMKQDLENKRNSTLKNPFLLL